MTRSWPHCAWYAGLEAHASVSRYLAHEARPVGASSRGILGRIRRQIIDFAKARHQPDLAAIFTSRPSRRTVDTIPRAIETLRQLPLPVPQITDAVEMWLSPRTVRVLHAHGIRTLFDPTVRIPRCRRWWSAIDGPGVAAAHHVEAFFAAHPALTERARVLIVAAPTGHVTPWEHLRVPHDVDGSRGGCSERRDPQVCSTRRTTMRLEWSYGWSEPAAQRLRFLLDFRYATGLHAGELVGARLGDIQAGEQGEHWLHVVGKGEKHGKVALPPLARSVLDRYVLQRGLSVTSERWDPITPLIVSLEEDGAHIESTRFWRVIKRFFGMAADAIQGERPATAEKLRRASPHWIRYTHASHALALARGAKLVMVRDNLRHAEISTTSTDLHSDEIQRARQFDQAFGTRRSGRVELA